MGSWRVALAVWVVAAAAWLAVALDCGARDTAGTGSRRLVALESDDVAALRVGDVSLRRREGGGFASGTAPADAERVDVLIGALGHTWVRRVAPGEGTSAELGLAEPAARLSVTTEAGRTIELRRGVTLEGRDLVWVGVGRDAFLITATEAGQLFPEPRRLLEHHPVRAVADAVSGLELTAGSDRVVASGDPLAVRVGEGAARIDRGALATLVDGLRTLELAPGTRSGAAPPLAIHLSSPRGTEWIEVRGTCGEGRLAVATHLGEGCVAAAPLERARALVAAPLSLVERALVDPGRRVERAELRRGAARVAVDPSGPGREAARQWLAELASATAGEAERVAPKGPEATPEATIELDYESGEPDRLELWRQNGRWWGRRAGESVALALGDSVDRLLAAQPVWFRDRELLRRDPSEVAAIRRGERELPLDLAPRLAHLTALRWVAPRAAPEHGLAPPRARVSIDFHPAPVDTGDSDHVVLEIGGRAEGGCYARLAGDPAVFVLEGSTCDALAK